MKKLEENNLLVPTDIIRSSRRTISLILKDNGDFIVRAPIHSTERKIFDFISLKANWIIKKRNEILSNRIEPLKLDGSKETIPYLGEEKSIELADVRSVKIKEGKIFVSLENSKLKLKKFLMRACKKILLERVQQYATKNNLHYGTISVRDTKTRWGSCGASNNLNFNYKLILCPYFVLDYIIVHELSHTIHKNHSKKFWHKVAEIMPDYNLAEHWLKTNKSIVNIL